MRWHLCCGAAFWLIPSVIRLLVAAADGEKKKGRRGITSHTHRLLPNNTQTPSSKHARHPAKCVVYMCCMGKQGREENLTLTFSTLFTMPKGGREGCRLFCSTSRLLRTSPPYYMWSKAIKFWINCLGKHDWLKGKENAFKIPALAHF